MTEQAVLPGEVIVAALCWGGDMRRAGVNNLKKLVRKATSLVGIELDGAEVVTERRMRVKLKDIMDNPSHPL